MGMIKGVVARPCGYDGAGTDNDHGGGTYIAAGAALGVGAAPNRACQSITVLANRFP